MWKIPLESLWNYFDILYQAIMFENNSIPWNHGSEMGFYFHCRLSVSRILNGKEINLKFVHNFIQTYRFWRESQWKPKAMTKLERNNEEFPLFLDWMEKSGQFVITLLVFRHRNAETLARQLSISFFFGILDKVQVFFFLIFLLGEIFLYLLCVFCVILKKKKLKLFWFLFLIDFVLLFCYVLEWEWFCKSTNYLF